MSRIPAIDRNALSASDQEIWDRISSTRGGSVSGPFAVLMQRPALAELVDSVGAYFNTHADLPEADCEFVVLATVREMGARFPWGPHERRAHLAGTRSEAIEALRALRTDDLTTREGLLLEVVRALLRTYTLPEELFARALAELGPNQLVETVVLVSQYGLLGLIVNSFAVPPPEGVRTF